MATLARDRVLTYEERYDALRATKLAQTIEKQRVVGAMDHDDWGMILPPAERRAIVDKKSGKDERWHLARLRKMVGEGRSPADVLLDRLNDHAVTQGLDVQRHLCKPSFNSGELRTYFSTLDP